MWYRLNWKKVGIDIQLYFIRNYINQLKRIKLHAYFGYTDQKYSFLFSMQIKCSVPEYR
jgi:hypothetical protein